MQVVTPGTGAVRQAPVPNGPTVEILIDAETGAGQLATARVTLPPGAAMSKHAHGESAALVVPLTAELLITSGDHQARVTRDVVVLLDRGEQVSLENPTGEPVRLLAVFVPADFVRTLSGWPRP